MKQDNVFKMNNIKVKDSASSSGTEKDDEEFTTMSE